MDSLAELALLVLVVHVSVPTLAVAQTRVATSQLEPSDITCFQHITFVLPLAKATLVTRVAPSLFARKHRMSFKKLLENGWDDI
jgi:hypothetical protein